MLTAAARPHVLRRGPNAATRKRVRSWPVGTALLEMLGDLNPDVREVLARERARLSHRGYPGDLPQPALWWPAGAPD